MEYQLETKPFVRKDGYRYKIIMITDTMVHTNKGQAPSSVSKKFQKSFEANEPGRIYGPFNKDSINDPKKYVIERLKNDPDFIKMIVEEEKRGVKILIEFPQYIPNFLGRDTAEFINSTKGQRIIRRLNKQNTMSKT